MIYNFGELVRVAISGSPWWLTPPRDPGNTEHKDGLPRLLLHARNDEKSVVALVLYTIIKSVAGK